MSSVWFATPTCRPDQCGQTFAKWQDQGYRTAAFCDCESPFIKPNDLLLCGSHYPGYARCIAILCQHILARDPDCQWIVIGGDDIDPDPDHDAEEIALQCINHFGGTLGIMQPTGDGFDANANCLVSPWLGREYIKRGYNGTGPLCGDYYHYWVDRELREVAKQLGILWIRPDLSQYHHHWTREGGCRPVDLEHAACRNQEGYDLFLSRQQQGFPGSQLCPKAM
jgi:hypothetical protein